MIGPTDLFHLFSNMSEKLMSPNEKFWNVSKCKALFSPDIFMNGVCVAQHRFIGVAVR
jgi:hypothetical protein